MKWWVCLPGILYFRCFFAVFCGSVRWDFVTLAAFGETQIDHRLTSTNLHHPSEVGVPGVPYLLVDLHHSTGENQRKNGDFPIKNGDFPIKNGDFPIKNGDFPIKNGDFPIKIFPTWINPSLPCLPMVFPRFPKVSPRFLPSLVFHAASTVAPKAASGFLSWKNHC